MCYFLADGNMQLGDGNTESKSLAAAIRIGAIEGWRLRQGYHIGLPQAKPTLENFLLRLHVLAWIILAGE